MECATGARSGSGCGTHSGSSDGQAHQRRFSKLRLDPAGQHHDAGARRCYSLDCTKGSRAGGKSGIATAGSGDVSGGGKEAAGAETRASTGAGFARACERCFPTERCSCSLE